MFVRKRFTILIGAMQVPVLLRKTNKMIYNDDDGGVLLLMMFDVFERTRLKLYRANELTSYKHMTRTTYRCIRD